MRVSKEKLLQEAEATGFRPEILEKVFQVLSLLGAVRSHPFLSDRVVLKGGTALNLFIFDLPRLSVDADLNYIGQLEREAMLADRPRVEQAVRAVCGREGLSVRRVTDEHAAGKWSLRYESALGQGGNLGIDLNFMFRVPLWPVVRRSSRQIGSYVARDVPVLDVHELAAGKLAALFARRQARDLFDVHQLLARGGLDASRLRLGFVVYGAMSRRDWRTVSVSDVAFDEGELTNNLLPLLRRGPAEWADRLVDECRERLGIVLPLSEAEIAFLDRLLDHGQVDPGLLTPDGEMAERIRHHPALRWKASNVRRHRGR